MTNKILILINAIFFILVWGLFSFGSGFNFFGEIRSNNQKSFLKYSERSLAPGEELSSETNFQSLPDNLNTEGKKIKMLFFGDMMLDRHVGEKINKYSLDFLFAKLASSSENLFIGKDIISANLEGAVTENGALYAPNNAYDFAFNPKLIDNLKKYNFNFFTIANNHLADQGERGIIETRNNLDKLGFNYAGCADGQAGECSYKVVKSDSINLGMAGFSLVYNAKKFDIKKAEKIIADLSSSTDLVIVNIHWGVEYEHKFNSIQQNFAHTLIDAGADLIIGHHPHVVQGFEIYKNKPIFYSLGNFIFDQYFSPDTQEELAVAVEWNLNKEPTQPSLSPQKAGQADKGRELEISLLPMKSKGSQPELMNSAEKERFFTKFIGWSVINEDHKKEIKEGKIITLITE